MTRSQKSKLFGRLSTQEQRDIVIKAHVLADEVQANVGIVIDLTPHGAVGGIWPLSELGAADWVRIVKPRQAQRSLQIADVFRSESRRRSAPWEGRGNRD